MRRPREHTRLRAFLGIPTTTKLPEEIPILAGLQLTGRGPQRPPAGADSEAVSAEESLEELAVLARSAGARVAESTIQSRARADAATLVGSGKVQDLKAKVGFHEATTVIF